MNNVLKLYVNKNSSSTTRSSFYFYKNIYKNFLSSKTNKFYTNNLFIQISSNKLNKNKNIFHLSKFNFSNSKSEIIDPQTKNLTLEATIDLNEIKYTLSKRQKVPFDKIIKLLSKIDRIEPNTRKECESFLLEFIRNSKFVEDYLKFPEENSAHKNYVDLFYNMRRISSITNEDIQFLENLYFDLDKPPRALFVQENTTIFDALYYYKRNNGEEKFKRINDKIYKAFSNFFTSFSHLEIIPIVQNILYLDDKEIEYFAPRMVDRMNYVINPEFYEKIKLSLEKKLEILTFYPRILNTIQKSKPEIFKRECERVEKFLIENIKNFDDVPSDNMVCIVSNYLNWATFNEELLEAFVPYLYRNLASFKPELMLEIFFLLLNCDHSKFKNPAKISSLINLIYQNMKNSPIKRIYNYQQTKEIFYYNETRDKLDRGFESWDNKDLAESYAHPDHYHKKLMRIMVQKSSDSYPFSAIEYDDKLFDRIFKNLKLSLKF